MPDLDFDFMTSDNANSFKARISRYVSKFSKEPEEVIQTAQASSKC